MIEIYWDDLTPNKQKEFLDAFGDNCNYDVIPITIIETDEETEAEYYDDNEAFTMGGMT